MARREPTLSRYRQSHMHSCGHVDDCFLQRTVAEGEPCRQCKSDAFNRRQAAKSSPVGMFRLGDPMGLIW